MIGQEMNAPEPIWSDAVPTPDGTHHARGGSPLYAARFDEVLKFHAPGLAPVSRGGEAWHIRPDGSAAYDRRFQQTFGFYEGIAAVADLRSDEMNVWHHINPDGSDLSPTRYNWCGNFQNGRCTVRDSDGAYHHITSTGEPAYDERWRYAGDFRDGVGVVQAADGLSTHINYGGWLIHGVWFLDLDTYHKGHARARDAAGWTHIDNAGRPLYNKRFAAVEPFYNGQARIELFNGAREIIDHSGQCIHQLRPALTTPLQRLSSIMVGFWGTQTVRAAVQLRVIDCLPATTEEIGAGTTLNTDAASRLLRALWELDLVVRRGEHWLSTDTGELLCRKSSSGMAEAALTWGTEHTTAWANLGNSLKTGRAAFDTIHGRIFFDWLADHPEQLHQYHRAMRGYAEHDYWDLPRLLPLDGVSQVIDAGGGSGALLERLLAERPDLQATLLDLPKVIDLVVDSGSAGSGLSLVGADLFSVWPCLGDLVVLARVLHDWDDERARKILIRARSALRPRGRVALVELVLLDDCPDGGLLDMNMLALCGSRERTLAQWESLVGSAGFRIAKVVPLKRYGSLLNLEPGKNGDSQCR